MRKKGINTNIKQSRFPISAFVVLFLLLLLMSGFHTGLIVLMNVLKWNEIIQSIVPVVYWALVAIVGTVYTAYRMKKSYEEPMHQLAEATSKVANGDFSVYISPQHTVDKLDYLDMMLLDFNKMVEELGSIETLKTDFFSNVSHEIKTPIAVIQNSTEMLKNKNISEEKREEYINIILQSTKRLSNLITNMLKLNKLEKQTIKPICEIYDIGNQLCEMVLQFEELWDQNEIELDVDIEEKVFVNCDMELLEIVWSNILSNALKFTPQGGRIQIEQRSEEDNIIICISDSGCGMDENTLRHIFEKFYQGDTSHVTAGNGLGLALVQRIVQLLDGTITVRSKLNQGTTFIVTLPKGK